MATRIQVLPPVPRSAVGTDRQVFDEAVRANLNYLRGRLGDDQLEPLPATATLEEVVAVLNRIISRLS
ncbi:MAG: hypothetical protein MUC68_10575 [Burkholderiaceae bacterium]|jgi:hypothetical protein|nr:hypothetical protein [Burkholderiaceae bacterium]